MRDFVSPVLVVLLLCGMVAPARAELTPDQVVVIGMAESEPSRELAAYYAKARGIPDSHVFLMEGTPSQHINRYQWEETYRPAILNWLKKQDYFANVRCLVTTWDVPLEISAINSSSPVIRDRQAYLREARGALVRQGTALIRALYTASGKADEAAKFPDPANDVSVVDLHKQLAAAMKPAQAWLQGMKAPGDRLKAGQFMDRVLVSIGGNEGMVRLAGPRSRSVPLTPEQNTRLAYLLGRAEGYRRGMQALDLLRATNARDEQAIELMQNIGGVFGAIQWIDQQLYLLDKNFTTASFDSELSILLWTDPPVLSWVPNPWHYSHDGAPSRRRTTLFVSRLTAPTPAIAQRMIDEGIAAEKTSPPGTIYLDGRGLTHDAKQPRKDAFTQYDQSLRDLAERLRKHSTLKVVLDDKQELFGPGRCPEAALYCGWHSPEKYVDAFEWSRGAVGYHLSGLEATWIQLNDDSRVQYKTPWCPSMLADGACATLGSCREAYLTAFPLPEDFFALLLTGKYSLAEVYYRTCPFLSWTVFLVGDPLYNPYKGNPKLSPEALPDRMNPSAAGQTSSTKQTPAPTTIEPAAARPGTGRAEESASPRTESTKEPEILLPGLDP
ncbi:MAG TPA: TIGR03790 family protein [Thermoguttaceae bacterium]|nr:TIGR03790 family protein [Thermoguttaceae bacterium]